MGQNKKYPLSVLTGIPSFGPMRNLGKIFSPSLFLVLFFKKSTQLSPVHYKWSHVEISESGIKKEWNNSNLTFFLRIEDILESPRELWFEGVGGWACVVWNAFQVILIQLLVENLDFITWVCLIICLNYIMNGSNLYSLRTIHPLGEGLRTDCIQGNRANLLCVCVCVCVINIISTFAAMLTKYLSFYKYPHVYACLSVFWVILIYIDINTKQEKTKSC